MEPWTDGAPRIFKSELSYSALPSAHCAEGKCYADIPGSGSTLIRRYARVSVYRCGLRPLEARSRRAEGKYDDALMHRHAALALTGAKVCRCIGSELFSRRCLRALCHVTQNPTRDEQTRTKSSTVRGWAGPRQRGNGKGSQPARTTQVRLPQCLHELGLLVYPAARLSRPGA